MSPTQAAIAEKELIERARTSKEAFLEIYELYFQRIYNYAYYRTSSQVEAEEVTSQTFLAALENIERFEYRSVSLAAWLYKIASNRVADLYRKKGKNVELYQEEPGDDNKKSPEELLLRKTEQERLVYHLQALPFPQQQALLLRYSQDLPYKEIAVVMDKSEGAVKQLLHRGLSTLRERMVRDEQ